MLAAVAGYLSPAGSARESGPLVSDVGWTCESDGATPLLSRSDGSLVNGGFERIRYEGRPAWAYVGWYANPEGPLQEVAIAQLYTAAVTLTHGGAVLDTEWAHDTTYVIRPNCRVTSTSRLFYTGARR